MKKKSTRKATPRSKMEELLASQLASGGIGFVRELRAVAGRRFRWDFGIVGTNLLVEVQGGVFTGGRHARGTGITKDCEKLCAAVATGWRQMNVTSAHVRSGAALDWIAAAIETPVKRVA